MPTPRSIARKLTSVLPALAALGLVLPAAASATVVTSTADSGAGSLRQAIADTAASGTITFDPAVTGTITLTTGELAVSKNLTIQGPGARVLSVSGNKASRVFAISGSGVVVTISGLTATNGQTPDSGFENGGGISVANGGSLVLQDGAVTNSHAGPATFDASGGGISVNGGGSATVTRSLIAGNTAEGESTGGAEGGGISASTPGTGGTTFGLGDPLVVQNSTVANNKVISENSGDGGGIDVFGSILLANSTVAFNSVNVQFQPRGGGVFLSVDGPANRAINQSVIAGNTMSGGIAGASDDCDTGGSFDPVPGNDNVVGDADECFIDGTNNLLGTTAPGITPLANNGGLTDTVALTESSPALDRVKATCPPPATDQRGFARPGGTACDSGAWEGKYLLAIDPSSHDFGAVRVGGATSRATSSPFRFTVTNVGDLPALLNSVTTNDPQFAIDQGADPGRCPITLAKAASCFVDIAFTPAAVGSATGALTVGSSNAGSVGATLTGSGFQPPVPVTPPDTCAGDKKDPRVTIVSDQGRRLYGIGQTASITTKATDAFGLKSDPSRKAQKVSTSRAGTFTVRKTATDTCNHKGSGTFRYQVVGGPSATIVHVPSPSGCRTRLIALGKITSTVPLRGSQIFVDGKLKVSGRKDVLRARILTRKLNNGTHRLVLSATDSLGRRVQATRTFVIRCSGR